MSLCPFHLKQCKKQNKACLGNGEIPQQLGGSGFSFGVPWFNFQHPQDDLQSPVTNPSPGETRLPLLASEGTVLTWCAAVDIGKRSYALNENLKRKSETIMSTL